jgi:hypothetical protein
MSSPQSAGAAGGLSGGRIVGIATLNTDNPSNFSFVRNVVPLSLLPVLCACPPSITSLLGQLQISD